MPMLLVGMDFYTNPVVRRVVLRGELSVNKIESSTKSYSQDNYVTPAGTENTYTLSGWNVSFTPQVLYNFYNSRSINCFLGAGASFNSRIIKDNRVKQERINPSTPGVYVQENYFPMGPSDLSVVLRGGLQLYNRFEGSVIWGSPTEYTIGNTGGRSVKAGQLIFSVGYLMNRSKRKRFSIRSET